MYGTSPETIAFLAMLGMVGVMVIGGLVFIIDTIRRERARDRVRAQSPR